MKKIILLLIVCTHCSKIDDPFFNLNPNRAAVYKEARDKCRRDAFLLLAYINGQSDEVNYKTTCNDPNSSDRKNEPDINECKRKGKLGSDLYFSLIISSCPKGLLDE